MYWGKNIDQKIMSAQKESLLKSPRLVREDMLRSKQLSLGHCIFQKGGGKGSDPF